MVGKIRFKRSFSNIFEKKGRRLMGLYEFGESGGFPGLGNIMITENFQRSGKCESLSIALYICVSRSSDFFGSCRATSAVIRS